MNKIGALLLSFTILFQSFNFDFNDIYKLPTFVNHIKCHIENGDNFSDFMDLHYGAKSTTHQNKHKEHQNLPFKHQHIDAHSLLVYVLNQVNYKLNLREVNLVSKNFNYSEPFSIQFIYSFFQPPQK
jgi:hypothetical protein